MPSKQWRHRCYHCCCCCCCCCSHSVMMRVHSFTCSACYRLHKDLRQFVRPLCLYCWLQQKTYGRETSVDRRENEEGRYSILYNAKYEIACIKYTGLTNKTGGRNTMSKHIVDYIKLWLARLIVITKPTFIALWYKICNFRCKKSSVLDTSGCCANATWPFYGAPVERLIYFQELGRIFIIGTHSC